MDPWDAASMAKRVRRTFFLPIDRWQVHMDFITVKCKEKNKTPEQMIDDLVRYPIEKRI